MQKILVQATKQNLALENVENTSFYYKNIWPIPASFCVYFVLSKWQFR